MSFNPSDFVGTADRLLASAKNAADRRTVVGRAYYAVYGSFRSRLIAAKGSTSRKLFGQSGKHTRILVRMTWLSEFKAMQLRLSGLFRQRADCDYEYDDQHTPSTEKARGAVDTARDLLEELDAIEEKHYRNFPPL